MNEKYLYHYTTFDGAREIIEYGYILPSMKKKNPRDARFGDGVYLTAIDPTVGQEKIVANNYDGAKNVIASTRKSEKTKYFFRFREIDLILSLAGKERFLGEVNKKFSDGRDIWIYPQGLVLDDIPFQFGITDENIVVMDQSGYKEYMETENAAHLSIRRM